jgi:ABC-type nitrate/sulfonate/bicarbonate transport system substrate-binding protein
LRQDLKIKDWPSLDKVAAGEADAAYVKGAKARAAAEQLGLAVLVDIDRLPVRDRVNNGTPRPITVHAELLERRPEVVIRFITQTLRAARWAGANEDEVIPMVARETGASADATRSIYGANLEAAITPTLSTHRLGLLEIEIDQLARHGFINLKPNLEAWAEPELLKASLKSLDDLQPCV